MIGENSNSNPNKVSSQVGTLGASAKVTGTLARNPYSENGIIYGDVIYKDKRGKTVKILKVPIKDYKPGLFTGIAKGDSMTIEFPNVQSLNAGINSGTFMTPNVKPWYKGGGNQAIPVNLASRIDSNKLVYSNTGTCQSFWNAYNDLNKLKYELYKDPSIVVIQHPSGQGAGLAVDKSQKGGVTSWDNTGKNVTTVGPEGVVIDARNISTGTSGRSRSYLPYGGMPASANPISDAIPKGNVFTPMMDHIPYITEIMAMLGIARAMMAVFKIAKQGVREVRQVKQVLKIEEDIEKVKRLEAVQKIIDPNTPIDEKVSLLEIVLGERVYYNDRDRLNKLKDIKRLRALIPVLQQGGQISENDAKLLKGLANYEQKELKNKGSTQVRKNNRFTNITNEAAKRAKQVVDQEFAQAREDLNPSNNLGSDKLRKTADLFRSGNETEKRTDNLIHTVE